MDRNTVDENIKNNCAGPVYHNAVKILARCSVVTGEPFGGTGEHHGSGLYNPILIGGRNAIFEGFTVKGDTET